MTRVTLREKAGYLSDVVFAASDGIVTTFAIVAGAAGASLEVRAVLVLGFANLFADGFSMASGNYLGVKSEIEFEKAKRVEASGTGSPLKHGLFTFVAFNLAGFLPLIPFVFKINPPYVASTIFVGLSLFVIGFIRSFYTKRGLVRSGIEMFTIGGFSSFISFAIGFLIDRLLT